jgi:hypothetical protein
MDVCRSVDPAWTSIEEGRGDRWYVACHLFDPARGGEARPRPRAEGDGGTA